MSSYNNFRNKRVAAVPVVLDRPDGGDRPELDARGFAADVVVPPDEAAQPQLLPGSSSVDAPSIHL